SDPAEQADTGLTLRNLTVQGSLGTTTGVRVDGAARLGILDSVVTGNLGCGVVVRPARVAVSSLLIQRTTITNNGCGVDVSRPSAGTTMDGSTVSGNHGCGFSNDGEAVVIPRPPFPPKINRNSFTISNSTISGNAGNGICNTARTAVLT